MGTMQRYKELFKVPSFEGKSFRSQCRLLHHTLETIYLKFIFSSLVFLFFFILPDTPCTLNEMFFRKLWVLGGKALSFGVKRIELRPKTSALSFSIPKPPRPTGTPPTGRRGHLRLLGVAGATGATLLASTVSKYSA